MQSCLKICGDCASAKNLPGCSRTGTRKSRAPSGVPRVMLGVQTSMKSSASIVRLIAAITVCCSRKLCCIRSRRRSSQRYLSRSVSSTFSSSSWNGSGVDRERIAHGVDLQLDLAGRQVRVDGLGRAGDDLALRLQDELVANLVRDAGRLGRALRVDHELHLAGVVAQVDEDEAAVVAARVGPARDGQPLADVLGAQFAAVKVAPAHGPVRVATTSSTATVTSWRPAARTTASRSRRITTVGAPERDACDSCPFVERPA